MEQQRNMEQMASMFPEDKRHIVANIGAEMKAVLSGQKKKMPTYWKGYRFIPGFEAESAQFAYEKYEYEPDSVFIISFPKTGTNWSAEVVREIMYGHDAKLKMLTKAVPPPVLSLEIGEPEKFELVKHVPIGRKLFISHLPEELVNVEKIKKSNGKMIVIVRNPKDQAVSWFHFAQKNIILNGIREELSSDWAQFLSDYMQGKHPMITKEGEWYPDHVLGWYKHKDDPNVLFVHFEDMKRDIKKEIRKMAKFIGIELTDERVDQIAESTTFSKMKTDGSKNDSVIGSIRAKMNLMRKGQVGEWKEVFTVAQSELMDKLVDEKLGKTDLKFTYEL